MKAGRAFGLVGVLIAAVPVIWLLLFITYYLPSTQKVHLAGTDVKRMDRDLPDGDTRSRDVRFIVARDAETGRTLMYRNEDTRWGWPPYFKFNSGDIGGDAANIHDTQPKATVLVKYYGWRIPMFDLYPNVVDLEIVDADYTHVPVFNIVFFMVMFGTLGFAFLKMRKWLAAFRKWRAGRSGAAPDAAAAPAETPGVSQE